MEFALITRRDDNMKIDWPQLQDTLFNLSVESLQHFASTHSEKLFYGFAFDCNADYGQVLLSLNTEEAFQQSSNKYAESDPEKLNELRWNPGNWEYQGFNTDFDEAGKIFNSGWKQFQEQIEDECLQQTDSENPLSASSLFLESVCVVLIRLEQESAFSCLQRTQDFKTLVYNHDESLDDAWERLSEVRQSPPTRQEFELASKYARRSGHSTRVYEIVDDQRREEIPYSDAKLLLRDSAVVPVLLSPGWWLVYANEQESFQVCYNRSKKKYQLTLGNDKPILLSNIREVAQRLAR